MGGDVAMDQAPAAPDVDALGFGECRVLLWISGQVTPRLDRSQLRADCRERSRMTL